MKLQQANKVYFGQLHFANYRNGTVTKAIVRLRKALATKRKKQGFVRWKDGLKLLKFKRK